MKIFISWSKENSTSHDVATALHEWLPDVIQGIEPWMSTHDIKSGELWGQAVSEQLEENNYGILAITPLSMESPWLIFEAGALAKFVDKSRVCPYLSGMTTSGLTGPLTQLQSRLSDRDGTYKLVQDINKQLESPISESRLERSFEKFWPDMEAKLEAAYEKDSVINSKPNKRKDRDLLEEILSLTRKLSNQSPTMGSNSNKTIVYIDDQLDNDDYGASLKTKLHNILSENPSRYEDLKELINKRAIKVK